MLDQFEHVGRAIADPARLRILKMLEPGELCVCQITAVLGLAPATVSKHLSILRQAGLLAQRKAGRWVHYRLAERPTNPYATKILALVHDLLDDDETITRDRQDLARVKEVPVETLCAKDGRATPPLRP